MSQECKECKLRSELKKSGIPATVDAYELSEYLDISVRRIYSLVKEGVVIKTEKGKFDLLSSIEGYISYLKDQAITARQSY